VGGLVVVVLVQTRREEDNAPRVVQLLRGKRNEI
jgi:hypothetical protein